VQQIGALNFLPLACPVTTNVDCATACVQNGRNLLCFAQPERRLRARVSGRFFTLNYCVWRGMHHARSHPHQRLREALLAWAWSRARRSAGGVDASLSVLRPKNGRQILLFFMVEFLTRGFWRIRGDFGLRNVNQSVQEPMKRHQTRRVSVIKFRFNLKYPESNLGGGGISSVCCCNLARNEKV
jgi:hypothetical protein